MTTALPAQSRAPHRLLLPAVCLSLATVVSAVTSLNVALPDLARDTGATQTEVSWIVDAYALVFASLVLVAGAVGDRYGRRLTLLVGLVLFGGGSAAAMLVSDTGALIGLRAVLGVGAALVMPATLSTITSVYTDTQRARAVAAWSSIAGASAVLGLVASGTLLEWYSWESVFGLNVALSVVAIALVLRAVPESTGQPEGRADYLGALLFVLSTGTLVYTVIEAPTEGWDSSATLIGFAVGAVLLAVTVAWELVHPRPLLDPRLFTRPAFAAGSLTITLQFAAFFGFMFLLLQYLQLVGDLSPLEAALSVLPFAAGMIGSSRASLKVAAHLGRARTSIIGLAIVSGSLFALSRLDSDVDYVLFFTALPFLGIGMGLAMTPATAVLTDALPVSQQGVASGVNNLSREMGGAIGIAVMGSVMTSTIEDHLGDGGGIAELSHASGPAIAMAMDAFSDGFQNALVVAASAVLVAAVTVVALTRGRDVEAVGSDADTEEHAAA